MDASGKESMWHAFLSHAQFSGGGQIFVLREALSVFGLDTWIDVDCNTSAESMRDGVARSAVFICFLSRTVFTRKFCQLELRTALDKQKPIIFVHEEDPSFGGAPISEILAEGMSHSSSQAEIAAGTVRVSAAELGRLFPDGKPETGVIPFRRGSRLLEETVPELVRRINLAPGIPSPVHVHFPRLKMARRQAPPPSMADAVHSSTPSAESTLTALACDVLLVGGRSSTHQLLFLETALRARAGVLTQKTAAPARFTVATLLPASSAALGAATARQAGLVVALLTADLWGEAGVIDAGACAAIGAALQRSQVCRHVVLCNF